VKVDRRVFMTGVSAGIATLYGQAYAAPGAMKKPFFQRHNLSLGVQIYSLINEVTADLDGTLQEVRKIGFETIELAGFLDKTALELRKSLDRAELKCTSIHIPALPSRPGAISLSGQLGPLVKAAQIVGARTIVMPRYLFAPGADLRRPDESQLDWVKRVGLAMARQDWERNADFMNDVGRRLANEGLRFSYHNQNPEFAPLPGGETGLEVMLRHTNPAFVQFELDVGWAVTAGLDPLSLLKEHKGRFAQMHVKDMLPGTSNYAFVQNPTSAGDGQIDWTTVLPAAYAAGVRDFFVEQDPPHRSEPMGSLARSFRYLTSLVA
jgi:sugar phosphate isomerase/epimerase